MRKKTRGKPTPGRRAGAKNAGAGRPKRTSASAARVGRGISKPVPDTEAEAKAKKKKRAAEAKAKKAKQAAEAKAKRAKRAAEAKAKKAKQAAEAKAKRAKRAAQAKAKKTKDAQSARAKGAKAVARQAAPELPPGTAIVTGATSGIGAAFARELARRGHDLIITGRRKDKIEAVAAAIREEAKVSVEVMLAELSSQRELDAVAARMRDIEQLDVLVNNAGFAERGSFHETNLTDHGRMLDVHCRATVTLTHAALPPMLARAHGTIINVSSLVAFAPLPGNVMYAATKSFINSFTESLHAELADEGIRLQALCPGMTRTDFHIRMGLDPGETYDDRGLMKALSPEEVVACSFDDLDKGNVVCLPGLNNRAMAMATRLVPRRTLYKITAKSFSRK